ncbi:alpha/beta-hydrolase [Coprinopsis marcescibilis]|uniref:Alpha/beta-hydrolase n=1 Tax=Coprinopsis marcescibilis TaxID=230819 RepID=A0A5C3KRS2_COPMA|nr:alpha/beta-hydrolase [Coprinopsis marcescibilis]
MPMPNALTTEVGFKVGPVLLEVLAKHYLERLKRNGEVDEPKLRQDNILYDEAFSIVKAFLNASTCHTIEDLQAFANTRTPSPPWVHVVRTLVPMSSCDQAALHLIKALGGEEMCRRVVGGVKWWQVRGINGVDAQWIAARKDWQEAKRRHKQKGDTYSASDEDLPYNKDMDAMRCILYLHGGGYYFGSVDQERYSIQRLARKINGRVFAINYRLAPQYPFPCAIQDALAAYLYLIRPPPGAEHQPVNPGHIVISGDSAGGGLSLALLQVIRDAGLPPPAGGLLISPWCDLTHSFPSIHLNTKTDVMPECGLSFHKPSTLWPPPSPDVSDRVHASIRHRMRQAFRPDDGSQEQTDTIISSDQRPEVEGLPVDVGATTSVPLVIPEKPEALEKISIVAADGQPLAVDNQIQFYTRNSLLVHPLVSAACSYLGNLPPLFIIASDKEVLRDEIIYSAHKAANPAEYPVKQRSKDLYPALNAFTEMKPTSVHLQVYDDTAHVLPILFAFTTPAKFCFRAMASFCKLVINMPSTSSLPTNPSIVVDSDAIGYSRRKSESVALDYDKAKQQAGGGEVADMKNRSSRPPLRRAISSRMSRASLILQRGSFLGNLETRTPSSISLNETPEPSTDQKSESQRGGTTSSDVAGPRFSPSLSRPSASTLPISDQRFAGDASVYQFVKNSSEWECGMIRERIAIDGSVRTLEPAEELDAIKVPEEVIGRISELALKRYIDSKQVFDKKFARHLKSVEKHRRKHLERAKLDTIKRMSRIKKNIKEKEKENVERNSEEYLLSSPGWSWAWALDDHESPPPSSIVSRRDTAEARELAEFADHAILGGDHSMSGNNLWSVMINFFTVSPETSKVPKLSRRSRLSQIFKSEKNLDKPSS